MSKFLRMSQAFLQSNRYLLFMVNYSRKITFVTLLHG